MKKIWFITLFPNLIKEVLSHGVIGNFFNDRDDSQIQLEFLNPSDFSPKGYKGVDSSPYGGSPGMVIRADVLSCCLEEGILKNYNNLQDVHIIYPTPRGKRWNNQHAKQLLNKTETKDIVFVCGRYEGVDERFLTKYVNEEISIGDYVLSGGELAAAIIVDSSLRFKDRVLGNNQSAHNDSFENNLLDSPKYTRPRIFAGIPVPDILLSGDHQKIAEFDLQQRYEQTLLHRPDLLKNLEKN